MLLKELETPKQLADFAEAPEVVSVKKSVVLLPTLNTESSLAIVNTASTKLNAAKKERTLFGLKEKTLATAAGTVAAVGTVVANPGLLGIAFLGAIAKVGYPHLKKGKLGKYGLHLTTVAGVSLSAAMAMNLYASPAQALFFQEAEAFFQTTFQLSGGAVTTIFNIFRAMYVVYLIYSAINIWTSYNRDDDWMSVAKAPMVIFIGGTLIDIVTSMIVA